jgi:hypothetical protein
LYSPIAWGQPATGLSLVEKAAVSGFVYNGRTYGSIAGYQSIAEISAGSGVIPVTLNQTVAAADLALSIGSIFTKGIPIVGALTSLASLYSLAQQAGMTPNNDGTVGYIPQFTAPCTNTFTFNGQTSSSFCSNPNINKSYACYDNPTPLQNCSSSNHSWFQLVSFNNNLLTYSECLPQAVLSTQTFSGTFTSIAPTGYGTCLNGSAPLLPNQPTSLTNPQDIANRLISSLPSDFSHVLKDINTFDPSGGSDPLVQPPDITLGTPQGVDVPTSIINPDGSKTTSTPTTTFTKRGSAPSTTFDGTTSTTTTNTSPTGTQTSGTTTNAPTLSNTPINTNTPSNSTTTTNLVDCDKFPDHIGCTTYGSVLPDTITKTDVPISITPISFSSGTCPPDQVMHLSKGNVTLSNLPICNMATSSSYLIIALAWLSAAYIVFGAVKT